MPYWRLFYHFTWGTKNRLPLILPQIEKSLYRVIAAKVKYLDGTVYAVGGVEDHIHLVVSVPPKLALSRFIGEIKGNSSHFINHDLLTEANFYWQDEYGVITFSEKDLPIIVRYVQRQRQHHCGGTVNKALEWVE
jgi:putative transposase